jgi:chemotaxis protein methyltransferase CheR
MQIGFIRNNIKMIELDLIAKDTQNFESLKKAIKENLDFDSSIYSDNFLKRRIEVRLRFLGINTYLNYMTFLKANKSECDKLKKELTIHTTNFYRDSSMYNFLTTKLIPDLVIQKKKTNSNSIKVWSAGSSTGEEAISIAICFCEALGNNLGDFRIKIMGTDYDKNTVERANLALYDEIQFSEMPLNLRDKYFSKINDQYSPLPLVKNLVSYSFGDILSPDKPKGIDVVFCRNTVIYFDLESKSRRYVQIYDMLPEGGFFIMGKTEILQGKARDLFKIYSNDERIYQK